MAGAGAGAGASIVAVAGSTSTAPLGAVAGFAGTLDTLSVFNSWVCEEAGDSVSVTLWRVRHRQCLRWMPAYLFEGYEVFLIWI